MSTTQVIERIIVFYVALLIAFAVFAYGLTTEATRNLFDLLLLGAVGTWLAMLIGLRRMPAVRRFVIALPGFLLLIGWVSVWNAGYLHDWEDGFEKIKDPIAWLPTSLNQARSLTDMKHISTLVMAGWMISDLSRDRKNRRILIFSLVLTGFAFALIGIFQKAAGARSLLFSDKVYPGEVMTFFASFRYHGNAATFLNYCWPVAVALLLANVMKRESSWKIAILACSALFTLSALFINTSKFGHVTTPFLVLLFGCLYWRPLKGLVRQLPHRKTMLVVGGVVSLAAMIAMAAISFSDSVKKWGAVEDSMDARRETYETSLTMIFPAGPFGLGPGTFSTAFPYYVTAEGRTINVFFHTAHHDYLQGLIEWGWIGGGLWILFFTMCLGIGLRRFQKGSYYSGAIFVAVLASGIQAFVDFPWQIASLQWIGVVLIGMMLSPQKDKRTSSW